MTDAIGVAPRYIILPNNLWTPEILQYLDSLGMTVVAPNLDSKDYLTPNDSITIANNINSILKQTFQWETHSYIISQSDLLNGSVNAVPKIISNFAKTQFTSISLSECAGGYSDYRQGKENQYTFPFM